MRPGKDFPRSYFDLDMHRHEAYGPAGMREHSDRI